MKPFNTELAFSTFLKNMAYKTTLPIKNINFKNIKCTEKKLPSIKLKNHSPEQFRKTELGPFNTRPTISSEKIQAFKIK